MAGDGWRLTLSSSMPPSPYNHCTCLPLSRWPRVTSRQTPPRVSPTTGLWSERLVPVWSRRETVLKYRTLPLLGQRGPTVAICNTTALHPVPAESHSNNYFEGLHDLLRSIHQFCFRITITTKAFTCRAKKEKPAKMYGSWWKLNPSPVY